MVRKNKRLLTSKTNKDDKLVVRIDSDLKERFIKYVEEKGTTVSDYIRQMIVEEMSITYDEYKSIPLYVSEITNPEIDIYKEIEILKKRINDLQIKFQELNSNSKKDGDK